MLPIIDFRNGRYQGETKNHLPNGVGIFFSTELIFVVAHWQDGAIAGKAIVIYPDATIFCGSIRQGRPEGVCFYELEREKIKVYFQAEQAEKKLAITIPNFNNILEVDSSTLAISGEIQLRRDNRANLGQVGKIIGIDLVRKQSSGRQFEGFINYFEQYFSDPYSDIFELLIINVNAAVEYWMGFRLEGLGIKVKPLPLEQSGGRTYRICEMGVMTRENVLFGVGIKTSSSVLGRVQVEEGIFNLPHTIISYRLSEGPKDKTRPTKCLTGFINFLKRSMTFHDKYLILNEVPPLKEQINKIHQLTFTEMKIKNAHQIIENPLKDQSVMADIEKKRRKKQEESELFRRGKQSSNLEPSIYNTGQVHPVDSSFNLNTIREDLYRSISKKKNSQVRLNAEEFTTPPKYDSPPPKYDSPPVKQQQETFASATKNKSSEKRLNGSITPTKLSKRPSEQKKAGAITVNKPRESSRQSPVRYPIQRDLIKEEVRKVPAPILKNNIPEEPSPSKRKVNYRDKELEEWQRAQVKFGRLDTSPKKYGRPDLRTNTKGSPGRIHSRPLLTENIFQN